MRSIMMAGGWVIGIGIRGWIRRKGIHGLPTIKSSSIVAGKVVWIMRGRRWDGIEQIHAVKLMDHQTWSGSPNVSYLSFKLHGEREKKKHDFT